MAMLSPGVKVNEIDLSIVVPALGNSTAAFAGEFTKGPSEKYVLITDGEQLISNFGKPTNDNYNDWFQAYNFLQYSDKLLVSRAVDANGTFTDSMNPVTAAAVGEVTVDNVPTLVKVGSKVKFDADAEDEFTVSKINPSADAAVQVDTITINSAVADMAYSVRINGKTYTYVAVSSDTENDIAIQLGSMLEGIDTSVTNVNVTTNSIAFSSSLAGVPMVNSVSTGDMTIITTISNAVGSTYALEFELVNGEAVDFGAMTLVGKSVLVKDSALNAQVDAPVEGAVLRSSNDLFKEALYVANEEDYEMMETSIPVADTTKLKFIAKSSGSEMNAVEIAIAREADFVSGSTQAFSGIVLNDLFENKPTDALKEIAIVVRKDGEIEGAYIVSLVPGSKDYRNKSNYVEDIMNKYSDLVYVKDNTGLTGMPASRLGNDTIYLSNGSDGEVNFGDIADAYGTVAENTIFGNKEDLDIDIVIANERARVAAGTLASDRADCIAFIGAKFEDVVGLKSAKIVENLTADVLTGDLNGGGVANSFNAYFGNYKYQYDKWNDKFRWVSVAGDVAGLRAETNTDLQAWWASAGLDRGQIKNAQKIAFNPNQGQRDMLYKNKVNPVVSFPGQGNAIVWGQKTLQSKASAFDRINVRGLFNVMERAIARMAKSYLFEFNDEFTRSRFVATITPFLEQVKSNRGVYDFYVRCDATNNTDYIIDTNQFVADIAVKPTRVAEFITLNFIAVGTGVDFNEIFV